MNIKEKRPATNHQQSTHQPAGQPTGPSPEGRGRRMRDTPTWDYKWISLRVNKLFCLSIDSFYKQSTSIPLVINMRLQVDKFTCKQVVLLEYW